MKRILLLAALLLATVAMCASDRAWVQGTLMKVNVGQKGSRIPTTLGSMLGQHDVYQVSVKVNDLIYTGETSSKDVRNLTIGDPVQVSFDDKYMYLMGGGNVTEIKAKVQMKERAQTSATN
jgi:hypothetical protein